jgi:hypothetical protein
VEAKATPSMAIVNSIFFIWVGFDFVGVSDLSLGFSIMQGESQP